MSGLKESLKSPQTNVFAKPQPNGLFALHEKGWASGNPDFMKFVNPMGSRKTVQVKPSSTTTGANQSPLKGQVSSTLDSKMSLIARHVAGSSSKMIRKPTAQLQTSPKNSKQEIAALHDQSDSKVEPKSESKQSSSGKKLAELSSGTHLGNLLKPKALEDLPVVRTFHHSLTTGDQTKPKYKPHTPETVFTKKKETNFHHDSPSVTGIFQNLMKAHRQTRGEEEPEGDKTNNSNIVQQDVSRNSLPSRLSESMDKLNTAESILGSQAESNRLLTPKRIGIEGLMRGMRTSAPTQTTQRSFISNVFPDLLDMRKHQRIDNDSLIYQKRTGDLKASQAQGSDSIYSHTVNATQTESMMTQSATQEANPAASQSHMNHQRAPSDRANTLQTVDSLLRRESSEPSTKEVQQLEDRVNTSDSVVRGDVYIYNQRGSDPPKNNKKRLETILSAYRPEKDATNTSTDSNAPKSATSIPIKSIRHKTSASNHESKLGISPSKLRKDRMSMIAENQLEASGQIVMSNGRCRTEDGSLVTSSQRNTDDNGYLNLRKAVTIFSKKVVSKKDAFLNTETKQSNSKTKLDSLQDPLGKLGDSQRESRSVEQGLGRIWRYADPHEGSSSGRQDDGDTISPFQDHNHSATMTSSSPKPKQLESHSHHSVGQGINGYFFGPVKSKTALDGPHFMHLLNCFNQYRTFREQIDRFKSQRLHVPQVYLNCELRDGVPKSTRPLILFDLDETLVHCDVKDQTKPYQGGKFTIKLLNSDRKPMFVGVV